MSELKEYQPPKDFVEEPKKTFSISGSILKSKCYYNILAYTNIAFIMLIAWGSYVGIPRYLCLCSELMVASYIPGMILSIMLAYAANSLFKAVGYAKNHYNESALLAISNYVKVQSLIMLTLIALILVAWALDAGSMIV